MPELKLIERTPAPKSSGDPGIGGDTTRVADDIVGWVRRELGDMARFRTTLGLDERLRVCARMRQGAYDPAKLAAIRQFGGSEVYARLAGNKVRGSFAILSGIFVRGERPWEIGPTPNPTLPEDVETAVVQAVAGEIKNMQANDMPVDEGAVRMRTEGLLTAAHEAAKKRAREDAAEATRFLDDILVEGGFYEALTDYLMDFCTYPFAVMRGPTAVMKTDVRYVKGIPTRVRRPIMQFQRVNPHDFLWTAGATKIEDAAMIERMALSRAQLNSMIGLPGFDEDAVRSVIRDYGMNGYREIEFMDGGREKLENQQSITFSDTIDMLVYTGPMAGWHLIQLGVMFDAEEAPIDPDLDYLVQTFTCGRYLLKVSIDPDPRNRVPYYLAAYEPIPGSIPGFALPELLQDVQEICNSVMRAAANNMAMASGPQVVVDVSRLADGENPNEMYPWKRWRFEGDPSLAQQKAIDFFQPNSNLQELTQAFQFFSQLGDEVSAIPRYLTGNERVGGAGRTASGLSMLMGNANKSMVSIAAVIDVQLLTPLLQKLYDLILITTGTAKLRGDENIVVRGATYAETKETDRMRQLEFLQLTGNPIDMQIMGVEGRSAILRNIADGLGMDGERIVPEPDEMAQAMGPGASPPGTPPPGGAQPGQPPQGQPGNQPPSPDQGKTPGQETAAPVNNMQRTRSKSAIAKGK